jgi:hypothetical protein
MRLRSLLPLVVAAVFLAGCVDGGEGSDQVIGPPDGDTATSTTTSSTTSTSEPDDDPTKPAATPTTAFEGSSSPTSVPAPPDATRVALLADVRVAGHEGFDRITFEFDGVLPGVEVGYVDPPVRAEGSGEEVAVDGEAFLEIRLEPASGVDLSTGEPRPTYPGPDRLRSDTDMVTELVRTGDFEANLTWVAGSRRRADFRVVTLQDPTRVVVEVAH